MLNKYIPLFSLLQEVLLFENMYVVFCADVRINTCNLNIINYNQITININ